MKSRIFWRNAISAAGLAAVLAACTVVVDEPGPGPRPPRPRPEPQYCTKQYDPVCARRGGDRQTFANSCLAERAGYRIIRQGECRDYGGGGGGGDGQTFCTREYRPVCARRHGQLRTFPNSCEAEAADWQVVDDGPC